MLTLRPYQEVGVKWIRSRKACLLADEQGLGKTVQALLGSDADVPCLIICPNSSKYFWANEIHKWLGVPRSKIYVYESWDRYDGSQLFQKPGVDYYIVHWEGLRYIYDQIGLDLTTGSKKKIKTHQQKKKQGRKNLKRPTKNYTTTGKMSWACVIADEAHRMKNKDSLQSKILRTLSRITDKRIALTGTPIVNRPTELWPLLAFLYPDRYTSYWKFFMDHVNAVPRFIAGQQRGFDIIGTRDPAALREELRPFVARRLKKNVMKELPDKLRTTLEVELHPDHRKQYDELRETMLLELDDIEIAAPTVLALMIRLRQLGDATFLLEPDNTTPSAKYDAVLDLVQDMDESKQTVIFVQFVRMAKRITSGLNTLKIPTDIIIGEVSAPDRQVAIEKFQRGDTRVLVLTLATGAESITLTAADTMIFVDKPWSPSTLVQAEDRIHRIGQEADKVHYIYITAIDTVDERVDQLLATKDFLFKQLFARSYDTPSRKLTREEVKKLL